MTKSLYSRLKEYIRLLTDRFHLRKPIAYKIVNYDDVFGDCLYLDEFGVWLIEISKKAFQTDTLLFTVVFHELAHIILDNLSENKAHFIIYKIEDIILDEHLPKDPVKIDREKFYELDTLGRKVARMLASLGDKNWFNHTVKIIKEFYKLYSHR